jgi:hypothetical protein
VYPSFGGQLFHVGRHGWCWIEQKQLCVRKYRSSPRGYDEPEILSYAISSFCMTSAGCYSETPARGFPPSSTHPGNLL